MTLVLTALFLLVGSFGATTIALLVYLFFHRPETRFAAVTTLLLVYAILALAPPVLFQSAFKGQKSKVEFFSSLTRQHGKPQPPTALASP